MKDIKASNYVSVQANETTDIACKFQFAIVLRFVMGTKPVQRFVKFVNVTDRIGFELAAELKEELEPYKLKD